MRAISLPNSELQALQRIQHRYLWRLVIFMTLYAGAALTAVMLASQWTGPTGWLIRIPFYLVAAASLHGISLFTHEGVHGALAKSPAWNRLLSAACALPVMQNFAAYKVLHLRHHADLGESRDPDHYANYTPRKWLVFLMNWGRLLLGYPAYITAIPILGFKHGTNADRKWIAVEVSALIVVVSAVLLSPLPRHALLHAWVIPMVIINTMVNIRGMSQHTLLPEAAHPIRGSRTILTNRVTAFFMCNENYHLEHHLFPRVPWYNLPKLHAQLKDELTAQGAPFIPSYAYFVREFVAASLRGIPANG